MSMLVRASRTRATAEWLLDQQILPTLSRCEFIDSMPENDALHGMVAVVIRYRAQLIVRDTDGSDIFLPPAIHRYHQLLMPVLQVVAGVLGSIGADHSSAGNQSLEFMISHRDTFVMIIKNNTPPTSLDNMREIQMLIHIAALVLPRVSAKDLVSARSHRVARSNLAFRHLQSQDSVSFTRRS
jgi:nuclear pore complex protein Nup205